MAERMLDLFVYLPAGVLLTAVEDTSEAVAKGRTRVDQDLRNAQVVGRFAVELGWRQLKSQIESLANEARDAAASRGLAEQPRGPEGKAATTHAPAEASRPENPGAERSRPEKPHAGPSHREAPHRETSHREAPHRETSHREAPHRETSHREAAHPETGRRAAVAPRDPEVDRAIPDYDILAASQVVRRLDGLDHDELRAVLRYERGTRARLTILQRAEQLLGGHPGGSSEGPTDPGSAV